GPHEGPGEAVGDEGGGDAAGSAGEGGSVDGTGGPRVVGETGVEPGSGGPDPDRPAGLAAGGIGVEEIAGRFDQDMIGAQHDGPLGHDVGRRVGDSGPGADVPGPAEQIGEDPVDEPGSDGGLVGGVQDGRDPLAQLRSPLGGEPVEAVGKGAEQDWDGDEGP